MNFKRKINVNLYIIIKKKNANGFDLFWLCGEKYNIDKKEKNSARLNLKMLNQNDLDLDFYSYHAIKV